MSECIFCEIVAGRAPAEYVSTWPDAIAIRPLSPVTNGHTLVIPRVHVPDAAAEPEVTGIAFRRAAALIAGMQVNLITSVGPAATQTVGHLHVHIVPRHEGDGLALPWTGQALASVGRTEPAPKACNPNDDAHDAIWQEACAVIEEAICHDPDPDDTEAQEHRTDCSSEIGRALLNAGLLHRHPASVGRTEPEGACDDFSSTHLAGGCYVASFSEDTCGEHGGEWVYDDDGVTVLPECSRADEFAAPAPEAGGA